MKKDDPGYLQMAPKELADLSYSEVRGLVQSLGQPDYRAHQLMKWVYANRAVSFDEMTDLPGELRMALSREISLPVLEVADELISRDGTTTKALLRLADGRLIESVLMRYRGARPGSGRATVCVSTQVGCPIGCQFCATGQQGFERNLSAGEILAQVLHFQRLLSAMNEEKTAGRGHRRLTNVVFMGMGEPLANYDSVQKGISLLNSQNGLGIGRRQITISTVGLVPQMRRLVEEPIRVELAVSLHAATDDVRNMLVPVNRRYPLAKLMAASAYYFEKTGRQPSFEYALFDGINDSVDDARRLAALLEESGGHVNLIAGNPTANRKFRPSPSRTIAAFQEVLASRRISNTLRLHRGMDIEAGCGQLRSRWAPSRLSSR